jgi:hypothetical protein
MGQGFDRRHQTAQQRFLGTVADALEDSSDQKTTATVMGKTAEASTFSKKATENIVEAKYVFPQPMPSACAKNQTY